MLKVAQSKSKITPEGRFFPPMMPNGHWAEDFADHQYASVMVLESDQTRLIWISLDAIGTSKEFSDAVRNRLGAGFGIPFENINIGVIIDIY